jgi:hypothetical protein
MYLRGQGKFYIGTRDALGNPQALRWVGNVPELKLGLETENLEHKESSSGQSLTDLKIPKGKSTSVNFTLEDFNKDNLAMALYGVSLSIAAGAPIVDEALGGTPAITVLAKDMVFIGSKRNAGGTVVLKDSSGTAKTLGPNVNYIHEPFSNTITLIDVTTGGPFVGPLKLSYTPGISTELGMFTTPQADLFMRFVGMNMADSGRIVTCDLYKVSVNPTKELSFITDELAQLQIEGAAIMDPTKPANALLGQFGAIYQQ